MKNIWIGLWLNLFILPVWAVSISPQDQELVRCNNFLAKNQMDKSITCLQSLADKKNPKAQYLLALFYLRGEGVPLDRNKGIKYIKQSAEQNLPIAQLYLASLYSGSDKKFPVNYPQAIHWYQLASMNSLKQGDKRISASADYVIGRIYLLGKLGKSDPVLALKYFKSAADKGLPEAQNDIFYYYWNGVGVQKNQSIALNYLRRAASQNLPQAKFALGQIYLEGTNTIKPNFSKAMEYLNSAANQGVAEAQIFIARLFLNGRGVKKSPQRAVEILENLAKKQNITALNLLGEIYLQGNGMPKSNAKALKYFKSSAKAKDPTAYVGLGVMYENGLGVKKSLPQAISYYEKAAASNNLQALINLGGIYYNRKLPYFNPAKAKKSFAQAEKLGSKNAGYNLGLIYLNEKNYAQALQQFKQNPSSPSYNSIGEMYFNGNGVAKSTEEAIKWFEEAVKLNNDPSALMNLIKIYYFGNQHAVDYGKAFPLLWRLAQIPVTEATASAKFFAVSIIAESYANGVFLKRNPTLALAWLYQSPNLKMVQKYIDKISAQLPESGVQRARRLTLKELLQELGAEINAHSRT